MRTVRIAILGVTILGCVVEPKGQADKKSDNLQGKWEIVSAEGDGEDATRIYRNPPTRLTVLSFEADKFTIGDGFVNPAVATFKIDTSTKPKSIDLMDFGGEGKVTKEIYAIENYSLKLCFG